MRRHFIALALGLLALTLAAEPVFAQRGRGTPSRPSQSPSRSTPSRSTPSVRPSTPSVRPSPSRTVRQSPSVRPSPITSRPSSPSAIPARPSAIPTRPSSTPPRIGTTPYRGSSPTPTTSSRGSSLYQGRVAPRPTDSLLGRSSTTRPQEPRSSTSPYRGAGRSLLQPDSSAPTPVTPGAGASTATDSPGRVRFPAPYRPAGSAGSRGGLRSGTGADGPTRPSRGWSSGSSRGTDSQAPTGSRGGRPIVRGVDAYRAGPERTIRTPERSDSDVSRGGRPLRNPSGADRAGLERPSPGERSGSNRGRPRVDARPESIGSPSTTRYGRGPVTRLEDPSPLRSTRPNRGRGTTGTESGSRDRLETAGALEVLRGRDLERAGRVRSAGGVLAAGYSAGIGASLAAAGGVYATPWLGAYSSGYGYYGGYYGSYWGGYYGWYPRACTYSPYGWSYSSYRRCTSFALTFNLDWWCSPYFWPVYSACWLPVYYGYYRPYYSYYSVPTYYETAVYRTVYETEYQGAVETSQPEPAPAAEPAAELTAAQVAAERYLSLGDRAFREGRYTDAVQLYAKAIEFSPDEGALHLVLADALFAAGDYHYGAYTIRRALELDPSLAVTDIDKHAFYDDPGIFDQQLAKLEQYVVDHPTDRDARLVLALNCLFGGRPAVAVDLLEAEAASGLDQDGAAQLILGAAKNAQYGTQALAPSEAH